MNFELSGEHKMLRDVVRRFVEDQLLPLEERVLEREANGEGAYLTPEESAAIDEKSQELELWGLDAPKDVGGLDLPTEAMLGIHIEMGRTVTPYTLPPDSPNLRMLMAVVNDTSANRIMFPIPTSMGNAAPARNWRWPATTRRPSSRTSTSPTLVLSYRPGGIPAMPVMSLTKTHRSTVLQRTKHLTTSAGKWWPSAMRLAVKRSSASWSQM